MNRKKVYALALVASLMMGIVPGTAAEGALGEISAVFTGKTVISTDSDFKRNTEYPIIAQAQQEIIFTIKDMKDGDVFRIKGAENIVKDWDEGDWDEGDWEVVEEGNAKRCTWTPEEGDAETGIFWAQVIRDGKVNSQRKIYVNPANRQRLMQLEDIEIDYVKGNGNKITTPGAYELEERKNDNNNGNNGNNGNNNNNGNKKLEITANIKSQPYGSKPEVWFTMSEPGIWSKRVWHQMENTRILENRDFHVGSGHYTVLAQVKDTNSIEAEDFKTAGFYEPYLKGNKEHVLTLREVPGAAGKMTVEATCSHNCSPERFEYAFLQEDDLGLISLKGGDGYDEENSITLPNTNWDYKLFARVKHKENSDRDVEADEKDGTKWMPDSFEAQIKKEIKRNMSDFGIQSVDLQASFNQHKTETPEDALLENQALTPNGTGRVMAGEKNYLNIVPDLGSYAADNFQYKAWAIDDGVIIPLGDYSKETDFVYYPKSGVGMKERSHEQHKLVISMRRLENNKVVEKVTEEFLLDVY